MRSASLTTRRVLKALSIFSGVQSLNIIVAVVRTKLVALWIGPAGVGVLGLYNWLVQLITTATQFNIGQSAVRTISQTSTNDGRIHVAALVRHIGLALGVAGAIITIVLSPWLSTLNFGDTSHTAAFIALASIFPLAGVATAESALMQGFERLRNLAKASVTAAVVATAIAVPLYYFFRLQAIVPVLILFALFNCLASLFYGVRGYSFGGLKLREALRQGMPMLKLGIYLTAGSFGTLASTYLFMVFLNRQYDESIVGLFNAGSTMLNSYVGIIFTAIALEFYPRLARFSSSPRRASLVINHECKVVLWILCPVIVAVIVFGSLVMKILYSVNFEPALPFLVIGIAGMAFKSPSWCLAYYIITSGAGRIYMFVELASSIIMLVLYLWLFPVYGFAGLGVAYVLWYFLYFLIVLAVCRHMGLPGLRAGIFAQITLCLVLAAICLYIV